MSASSKDQGSVATEASERRGSRRRRVSCRSAIWFDEGPEEGVLGKLSDVSRSGFSALLLAKLPAAFRPGGLIHCVLLIQSAHLDALVKLISLKPQADGAVLAGFQFEAISEQNAHLLSGVLRYLEATPAPAERIAPIRIDWSDVGAG
jgi:hypothetical protein